MVLSERKKPLIIAEAGVNHNGDLSKALLMVDLAAEAGADYIKFQTFKTESLVSKHTPTALYQKKNCGALSQFDMLKKLELSFDDFRVIKERCNTKNIGFLSTPFDKESLDFLVESGIDFIKISSGEITDLPLLERTASTGIPVIISTGMATTGEIEEALQVFYDRNYTKDKIILLHCTTQYPTLIEDVNLNAMLYLKEKFGLAVGYSDHTEGITIPVAATALGAEVIEKHFTLSREMEGPDHKASLDTEELKVLVREIRKTSEALGSYNKKPAESETENIVAARKSIVAARFIKKGELFSDENITVKRPGGGISPMRLREVTGKVSPADFLPDQLIYL